MEEVSDSINAFQLSLCKVKNIWGLLLKIRLKLDVCFSIENFLNLGLFIIQAFPAGKGMLLIFKKRVEKYPKLITRVCLALSTITKKQKATAIAYVKKKSGYFSYNLHINIYLHAHTERHNPHPTSPYTLYFVY